jgi:hypothetical protein
LASVGRATIKEQQQAALIKIQKNKEAALKQLNIQCESADKAKKSFGIIGITFLTCLFGGVFLNDLFKLIIYYSLELKTYWRRKAIENKLKQENIANDVTTSDIRIDIDHDANQELEDSLERVYFRLLTAKKKRQNRRKRSK